MNTQRLFQHRNLLPLLSVGLALLLSALLLLLSQTGVSSAARMVATSQQAAPVGAAAERCFTKIDTPFANVEHSSVAWADYDGDGDLDVLIAGNNGTFSTQPLTRLYRNNGSAFTEIDAGLMNLHSTSAAWADFDGDGDPDLLLTGQDSDFDPQSILYRNDNGAFVAVETPFVKVDNGAVAWADYDGDGDLDVVITGSTGSNTRAATLYRNDGGTFVDSGADLIGVEFSSVAWADYDRDGDPDLLLMGRYDYGLGEGYTSASTTRLYRNDDGVLVDSEIDLSDLEDGSAAWGDYDGDGDLDLIIMGVSYNSYSPTTNQITYFTATALYRNDDGTLTQETSEITSLGDGDVSWADYDGDGDLDFLIAGTRGGVMDAESLDSFPQGAILYQNNGGSASAFSEAFAVIADLRGGSVAWADYDRDGDPDLLVTGAISPRTPWTEFYRNEPCEGSNVFEVADGDVQGLIDAINAANVASTQGTARQSSSAVVNLAANGAYTLTAVENMAAGGNGLPVITGTVTINGNGATIARSGAAETPDFRILYITGTLTLDNVILSNGFLQAIVSPDQIGGAILNTGVLSLTNSTVQSSSNRFGGGVGNRGGVLYMSDTLVQNNGPTDANGGGVFNALGQMAIVRSQIRNNQAGVDGGGVANQQEAMLTLSDSLVTGNRAQGDGGGLYNRSPEPFVVMSSTISLNSADSSVSTGGGIANHASDRDSQMEIQHSRILSNTAGAIGGGIVSSVNTDFRADLVVNHSEIAGNRAVGDPSLPGTGLGGGIANANFLGAASGTTLMTITHSSIHHNEAVNGGGLGNALAGAAGPVLVKTMVESSAIYSNTATGTGDLRGNGGGIANADATLEMVNSTISGNRAVSDGNSQTGGLGGGLFNASIAQPAQLTFRNSTLTANAAIAGGGLTNAKSGANASATVSFQNTLVAGNTDASGFGPNCLNPNLGAGAGTINSLGHNLDSGATCGFTQSGDLSSTDSLLGHLADNGGPTWTHALMDNSPAIDAANSAACPATDQRGVARPVGDSCDIGAYEGGTTTVEFAIFLPMAVK